VLRGGSWNNTSIYVRAASRSSNAPSDRYFISGFRLGRTPERYAICHYSVCVFVPEARPVKAAPPVQVIPV
jgi:hypothetical protein